MDNLCKMIYYQVGKNLVYFPFKRALLLCGDDDESMDSIINKNNFEIEAIEDVVYEEGDRSKKGNFVSNKYIIVPKSIQIDPTTKCNLRCKYCFTDTGNIVENSASLIQIETLIKEAFKTVKIQNMLGGFGQNYVTIMISGGGEPTYDWGLFQAIVEYACLLSEQTGIKSIISVTSNLQIDDVKKLDFILSHCDHVHVSFDGYKEIHDYQRPREDKKSSFDVLDENLKYMLSCTGKRCQYFGLRTTITNFNADKMGDITKFVVKTYNGVKYIQYEPLNWVRKTNRKCDIFQPSADVFVSGLFDSVKIGYENELNIESSFLDLISLRVRESFCDSVVGNSIALNSDGDLVCCSEAIKNYDKNFHLFHVGHINENSSITWLKYTFPTNPMHHICKNCYAFYHCGGGCLHSILDYSQNKKYRCAVSKAAIKHAFEMIIKGKGEYFKLKSYTKNVDNATLIYWIPEKIYTGYRSRVEYKEETPCIT